MPDSKLMKDEDFIADCEEAAKEEARYRGVHPKLSRCHMPVRHAHESCRACGLGPDGRGFDEDDLTEDGLCSECNRIVKGLEDGKI